MTTKGICYLAGFTSEAQGQLSPTCCQTHSVSHVSYINRRWQHDLRNPYLRTGGTVEVDDNLDISLPGNFPTP